MQPGEAQSDFLRRGDWGPLLCLPVSTTDIVWEEKEKATQFQ